MLPPRDIRDLPLSSYLRLLRIDKQVPVEDVAIAVESTVESVQSAESLAILPWKLDPLLIANLACFYRIKIETLKMLSINSRDIAYFSSQITDRDEATNLIENWLANVALQLESQGASDLLR